MVLKRSRAIRGCVRGLHFGGEASSSGEDATWLLCHGSQSSVIWDIRMQSIVTTLAVGDTPTLSSTSRVPDRMAFLAGSRTVLAEFGSEYAGRHRPSPAVVHRLYSASDGWCVIHT